MNWKSLVEDYLTLKRELGFALLREGEYLQNFACYAQEQNDCTSLTISLALQWANLTKSTSKTTVAKRFGMLRPFSRHLAMHGYDAVALPSRFLGSCQKRLPPYIFSDTDIDKLMNAALELCPKNGLRAVTVQVLIGLLVSTGLRPGEAVRLQDQDVRLDLGEIVIQQSKGWQYRLVPLSISTVNALKSYVVYRDSINVKGSAASFFQLNNDRVLDIRTAAYAFGRVRKVVGLSTKCYGRYPTLYNLRHTFVCRRIKAWYHTQDDIDCRVTQLSRYLGHKKVSDTYWYITSIPSLMAIAAKRFAKEKNPGETQ